jgi:hypothetical protein
VVWLRIFILLRCDVASLGNWLKMFLDNTEASCSMVKNVLDNQTLEDEATTLSEEE